MKSIKLRAALHASDHKPGSIDNRIRTVRELREQKLKNIECIQFSYS